MNPSHLSVSGRITPEPCCQALISKHGARIRATWAPATRLTGLVWSDRTDAFHFALCQNKTLMDLPIDHATFKREDSWGSGVSAVQLPNPSLGLLNNWAAKGRIIRVIPSTPEGLLIPVGAPDPGLCNPKEGTDECSHCKCRKAVDQVRLSDSDLNEHTGS